MTLSKNLLPVAFLLLLGLIVATHGLTCSDPSSYVGQVVCDFSGDLCGECVSFVKKCTGDRRTTGEWTKGQKVRGTRIAYGTAIATFPGGKYRGHAAIYVSQNHIGILVYDQWNGRPVNLRRIRWNGGYISDNGDSFYVID